MKHDVLPIVSDTIVQPLLKSILAFSFKAFEKYYITFLQGFKINKNHCPEHKQNSTVGCLP